MAKKYTDAQIQGMLEAGKSPRFRRIETYQKYWDGTVYEGRPGFLDQSVDVPLLERAPCVVYPIVRAATQAICSMSMGLGKFPEILSMTSEDDTVFDERFASKSRSSWTPASKRSSTRPAYRPWHCSWQRPLCTPGRAFPWSA